MDDQNVNGKLDDSLVISSTFESGEARIGSAEATSLFTGSPSRASQVEGDQIAESGAVIDAPELHEQNSVSSAPVLTAVASESVSVSLSFLSCIAPHANYDLTVLTLLLTVASLLKSRFNREQDSHRSPLCWTLKLRTPVNELAVLHYRTVRRLIHRIIFRNRLPLLLFPAWLMRTAHFLSLRVMQKLEKHLRQIDYQCRTLAVTVAWCSTLRLSKRLTIPPGRQNRSHH